MADAQTDTAAKVGSVSNHPMMELYKPFESKPEEIKFMVEKLRPRDPCLSTYHCIYSIKTINF